MAYQELVWRGVPLEQRAYLPTLWSQPPPYIDGSNATDADADSESCQMYDAVKLVALITTRDVKEGEEFFADYFTIVT